MTGWFARGGNIKWKWLRRCAVALVGGSVVLVGICMLVLPGPAIVVIPAGLAILGLEFAWARLWLRKVRVGRKYAAHRFREKFKQGWFSRYNQ